MAFAGDRVVVLEPSMVNIHQLARRVAASDISVLLLGETGCGKEILAETVHRHSRRKDRPMLRLNCAALSESLLESELFGHEKGAFSGATQTKSGLLEIVNGGTVFLDEVGEMPLSLQAKLLRVIEDRKVTRVGGLRPRDINVRFVTATNRNLSAEVALGTFRADLYYRFNGVALHIPPLRERPSEIEPLATMFLERAAKEAGRRPPRLSPEVRVLLRRHTWPGNVRELRNIAERALAVCADSDTITMDHLPVEEMARAATALRDHAQAPAISPHAPMSPTRGRSERQRIADALQQCAGNQSSAAKMLGISRTTLVSRLIEYNLPRPRARRRRD
ncbi:sigma-54 dependent transcriptional regulator [Pendulispora rubella]|uniref:Sigma-54 dependent transcriptional regulator n=1 Tax=Pendulispora rubella TaxID=2741070 RepID=A0ABZ2KYU6_9BACT